MQESVNMPPSIARDLLPVLGQSAQSCDSAAPARAMAVAGLGYVAGVLILEGGMISPVMQWVMIGLVAAAIQIVLFAMPGLLSSDILDYASHGRVAGIHAANPYVLP